MKNLQEIKEKYAIEQGYEDWESIISKPGHVVESHMNEICIRAQRVALENASENAKTKTLTVQGEDEYIHDDEVVDRTSITNTENLIR